MENNIGDIVCTKCGKTDNYLNWIDSEIKEKMIHEKLCFNCSLFQILIDNYEDQTIYVNVVENDNQIYMIDENKSMYFCNRLISNINSFGRVFGGREWYIKFVHPITNEVSYHWYNDIWHRGQIPEHFKSDLIKQSMFVMTVNEWWPEYIKYMKQRLTDGCKVQLIIKERYGRQQLKTIETVYNKTDDDKFKFEDFVVKYDKHIVSDMERITPNITHIPSNLKYITII